MRKRTFLFKICALAMIINGHFSQGMKAQEPQKSPNGNGSNRAPVIRDQQGGDPMFKRIMYVTVFVSDQDKALDFYTSNFGFQKHADYKGPEGRFLTIALKDQGFEVLLWLGSAGRATTTSGK